MTEAQQAHKDLLKKLRLERIFRPEVKSLFARMVKDHAQRVAAFGTPLDARKWRGEWEALLRKHYVRAQSAFKGVVTGKKQEDDESPPDEALLAAGLLMWRDKQAQEQANAITETTAENVAESMQTARASLIEEGEDVDNRNLAVASAAILRRMFQARAGTIVMYETQSAAETTKMMEALWQTGTEPSVLVTGEPVDEAEGTKTWRTVGDKKVREKHRLANGQIRPIHKPFEVAGDLLMYPSDALLGAKIDNVINCRCSAVYSL